MQEKANERASKILLRVHEERALLAILERKISNHQTREVLTKPIVHLLNDVEIFFLDADVLAEDRTLQVVKRWLDAAERVLRRAIQEREKATALIEQYGPDAKFTS